MMVVTHQNDKEIELSRTLKNKLESDIYNKEKEIDHQLMIKE
jgi:hypothetical protein